MNYNELKSALKEKLEEMTGEKIVFCNVVKNNCEVEMIRFDAEKSVAVGMDDIMKNHKHGKSVEEIARGIALKMAESEAFGVPNITKAFIMKNAFGTLVSREDNSRFLEDKVFYEIKNTDLCFAVRFNVGIGCAYVTQELLNSFGLDKGELIASAILNVYSNEYVLQGLQARMYELAGLPGVEMQEFDDPMLIWTNEDGMFGANVLVVPGWLDNIHETVGDFFIIPSSIHELIIVPASCVENPFELWQMLMEVNVKEVDPQDRLSNHIYKYDGELRTAR